MTIEDQKRIIVLSAPSGAGKSTIVNALIEKNARFKFSISTTTRAPRTGEKDGVNYYFVSQDDFKAKREAGDFLEWAQVHSNFYGTTCQEVERIINNGDTCLLDIDVQGALQVEELYPYSKRIFILPPSIYELEARLKKRGDTAEEDMKLRMGNALEEMKFLPHYQYFVVNRELDLAIKEVQAIIDENE